MIEKKLSLIISFNKTVDAIAVEEYGIKQSVAGRLIPLPKEISAGCGLAWKCDVLQKEVMIKIISELNIELDKMTEIVI